MKICPICQQTYTDDEQNFCLNDGSVLRTSNDDAPPTVFMSSPRVTDNTSWQDTAPLSAWQNQSPPQQQQQNRGFANASFPTGQNQTLPTVSLILGVLSIVLICCQGGLPFGIAAFVAGYLGLSNANKNPSQFGGRGLAIAGLILGALGIFSGILFIIFAIIGKH